ncbi:MAG: hypothetical protein ACK5IM_11840 [Demequina sp.]|uniref:hypothetical protein n=1 Tax=Demequina sp. TaxID=2050685 RepID=UPI003A8C7FB1
MTPRRALAFISIAPAVAALAACSSSEGRGAEAIAEWEPDTPGLTSLDCAEVFEDWATGDAPEACWTFEEGAGLADRFLTLTAQSSDTLGADPVLGPSCMDGAATGRAITCRAVWEDDDQYVVVNAGITLHSLEEAAEDGIDIEADTPLRHELTVWITDDAAVADPDDFALYHSPIAN